MRTALNRVERPSTTGLGRRRRVLLFTNSVAHGGMEEHVRLIARYLDRYRREQDGRWRFAKRVVTYDLKVRRALDTVPAAADITGDASYAELVSRLFARGERA